MKKGKHVLVEKPMAMNTHEADEMIAARDSSGCILAIGMNQRFNELRAEAKTEIDKGKIGTIQYGRTRWLLNRPHRGLWGRGDWFLKGDTSGGAGLIDIGVHRLDLALYMMGFPEPGSVSAINTYGIGKRM
jgi:predicted dehydrogenase